jgi:hypothetical protein
MTDFERGRVRQRQGVKGAVTGYIGRLVDARCTFP